MSVCCVCKDLASLSHDRKYRFEMNFCVLMIICFLPTYIYMFMEAQNIKNSLFSIFLSFRVQTSKSNISLKLY